MSGALRSAFIYGLVFTMSLTRFILLCLCGVGLYISALAAPAYAQGASDDLLQFLPTSERFLGRYATQSDEFAEPVRGPAELDALNNSQINDGGKQGRSPFKYLNKTRLPAYLTAKEKPSALEDLYVQRTEAKTLSQFGYDLFGPSNSFPGNSFYDKQNDTSTLPSGAVQDDFVLGAGDVLDVMFTGQRNGRERYTINAQGTLVIDDFAPIPAAGKTIAQLRSALQSEAMSQHNTQAFVSLAQVRQVGALVIGHVKYPGRKRLSAFHTVIDALMQAGGIEKTGSLRQIKLVRDGRSVLIDIYDLLLHGNAMGDLNIRDGDRIIVPPVGPTVAVAGEVKRPGIYELLPERTGMRHEPEKNGQNLSLNEMLELGGGVLSPGQNRFLKLEPTNAGEEKATDIHAPFTPVFGNGSILMVSKGEAKRAGTIELTGHTRRPGLYALSKAKSLSALLSSESLLGHDIYPLIGVIERWDDEQLTHKMINFPLRLVLKGDYDRSLKDGDVVHLFSNAQITNLRTSSADETVPDDLKIEASYSAKELESDTIKDEGLAAFLRERSAFVRGAVRKPGPYPVDDQVSLDSLLAVAGGLSLEANTSNIEITSDLAARSTQRSRINFAETNPKEVMIGPGDSVRVNQKFKKIEDKSILIMGEVRNPGRYDLLPGDQLSDLLERAGGFTAQAYPAGAIFSREAERRAEESRFRMQAREIKRSIASALEMDSEKVSPAKIAEARALAEELENVQGVGRITVEADLGRLRAEPALDILLEAGDRIYIPKRSLHVRVRGDVLSPASLQFREGKDPLDYIHEAGGFSFHADKDRTFVLYPDGSAQPLHVSPWNHRAAFIPPGSTIVVPRDPEPFDFIQSAKDISQILSNLAITAVFIDDVTDSDS